MKNIRKILALVLALGMILVLAACKSGTDTAAPEEAAADSNTLIMATSADFPPYEFMENNDFAGVDIEIAKAIANKIGMTLDIQNVNFDAIIAGVATGKYQMGMSGITATDERRESVDFSDSYTTAVQAIVVKSDSGLTSLDDIMAIENYKIGVQLSTTGDIYVTDDCGVEHVTEYKTGADAIQALATDKVNAVVIDNEPAKNFVAANEGLTILASPYVQEEYAIALNKDNTELNNKINTALQELIADGTVQSILDKYITA
ncbi:MAG: transporter substrate-binding domain-containing protein [Clostridia bacterium]|nr:transporter substrate-binding domain-containing protein [Clostridia bacterium]